MVWTTSPVAAEARATLLKKSRIKTTIRLAMTLSRPQGRCVDGACPRGSFRPSIFPDLALNAFLLSFHQHRERAILTSLFFINIARGP